MKSLEERKADRKERRAGVNPELSAKPTTLAKERAVKKGKGKGKEPAGGWGDNGNAAGTGVTT